MKKNKTVEDTTSVAHIEQILSVRTQQCKSRRSTSILKGQERMQCYLNSNFSMSFERFCQHNMYTYRKIRVQCTSKPFYFKDFIFCSSRFNIRKDLINQYNCNVCIYFKGYTIKMVYSLLKDKCIPVCS